MCVLVNLIKETTFINMLTNSPKDYEKNDHSVRVQWVFKKVLEMLQKSDCDDEALDRQVSIYDDE